MTLIGMLGKICGPKFRHCCSGIPFPFPVLPVAVPEATHTVVNRAGEGRKSRDSGIVGESGAKQTASFCGHKSVDIIFVLYSFLCK